MRPVPAGVAGELYVGGANVARGYLKRPALTAERFLPDPFGAAPGGRLYRTGDVVRWNNRGELEVLGRADEQVKVRGFRVEPGEIEAALHAHASVREAVVIAAEDARAGTRLVAYVVPRHAAELREPADELRAHLKERLPDHMIPSAFVVLDELPLTPNGKLDRRRLPEPERQSADTTEGDAPLTPTEEVVAGIWADALGLERVGRDADFFELGGHSLLATEVVSRLRELFSVELPIRSLFESPTVATLAAALTREGGRRRGVQLPPGRNAFASQNASVSLAATYGA
jgi:acyl carrier protein